MKALPLALIAAGAALLAARVGATGPDPAQEPELLAVVQSGAGEEARARALQQLALVASAEAVPAVAPLLGDPHLGQYARDVLERIPDQRAGAALVAALGRLQGDALVGAVNSLGVRRDAKAAKALEALAGDPGSPAAAPTLLALGRIGTPEAMRFLRRTLARGPGSLHGAAAEGCLTAASRLRREGENARASGLFAAVRDSDAPAPARAAAVRGLILDGGSEGAALLVGQLRSPDRELRNVALESIADFPGPELTPRLARALAGLDPATEGRAIAALARRPESGVRDAIAALAENAPGKARAAALGALGAVGDASSLPILLQALQSDPDGPAGAAASVSLERLSAASANATVLTLLPAAPPPLRIRLIGVLGERLAFEATPELLRQARDSNPEVDRAALRALGLVAGTDDLPQMIAIAQETGDETRPAAEAAVAAVAMKEMDPRRRTQPVIAALGHAPGTEAAGTLLASLRMIAEQMRGSPEAFAAVTAELHDPDAAVRAAALSCLTEWPSIPPGKGGASLFDGKDLTGWVGTPGVWRVRDGVIVGGSLAGNPRNEFLATVRTYRNFVLRAEYKLVGTQGTINSGIQFRSIHLTHPPNEMYGFQADIGNGHTGGLYDESRRKRFLAPADPRQIRRLEKPGDWNRYEVRCDGPRMEIWLNGERTAVYVESDPAIPLDGLIGLQIHAHGKAEVSFRDLVIQELP